VIERARRGGTLFLVAKTLESRRFEYKVHALNILTGKDRNPPVQIAASVENSAGRILEFDPRLNLNRPGLLLKDGVIYIAFGSHADAGPFYGWIMAYDSGTLTQLAVYNTAPDWGEGGVWQSGTGLADHGHPSRVLQQAQEWVFHFRGGNRWREARGADQAHGTLRYEFHAKGQGASLTGTKNPVPVMLAIGDDSGTASVKAAIIQLRARASASS
jgi:hypothetical protein